ncbi:aminotransferase class I/II-fold pyridoxal phosphate-dependent enzyme [Candidatus Pelagibacter sp.]|nr:aminotransferase class I/II-fold pyridoxal phosphate-dependent enzyme [Candidatus Pelagibacter sp.]
MMKFNDLDLINSDLNHVIIKNLKKVIKNNNFIFSQEVTTLENKLKILSNSKYAITTGSGTDSLILSLLSLDIKRNKKEIIIPAFSWLSVAEVVLLLGFKPIYADVEIETFNIDIKDVEKKISKNTLAVISTSLFGRSCNLLKLKKICKINNVIHIEDAAQNLGSKIKNKNSCSIADITCTSFFPTKNLGGYGDGGAVFTNQRKIYKKILLLRNHGQKKYSYSDFVGLNSRIGSIQAAVLNKKIKNFKIKINNQIKVYKSYQRFFKKNLISGFPEYKSGETLSQFNILLKKRSEFIKELKKVNMEYKVYYPKPLYRQFNQKIKKKMFLRNSEYICKQIISLPFNDNSKKRHNKVLNTLQVIIDKNKNYFFEKKK